MGIKIKNLLYQPVPITDDKGVTTMLTSREKRVMNNLKINDLPKPVQGLQKKKFIKIKEA